MSGIKDKVIVITGASSGIGEATAMLLAERGAKIVLGARRLDRLEALANRIETAGGKAAYAAADVRHSKDLSGLVQLALEKFGKLDVLVNNAGFMPMSPLDDLRIEEWEAMIDINIKGVLYGIAAALPTFRDQGSGHFINIASTAAYRILPNMSVYAGTKLAVRAISEGLRQEAGDKLRVTTISPGFTSTPGSTRSDALEAIKDPDMKAKLEAYQNIGLSPYSIANAIAFAIEQPNDVDVSELVVRPTAQG
ncbi:SDR family oxidoreductase [Falsibacillus pallidus]|uniref:NADP-dependent 3-hydroxy acid dehydrogenase YdfG n=1 Tax=Falsibacillus pallidus TaxID=493781 RepID=A0A370GB44_9BACI|nr:SDR family oxidoreductase [Falsibacillus pallidus]RDI40927.1 NADP-dependent 3-hydroxy acid dehydrogenase YdfG [Falsibacillus pallidus]